jgi:hypothetical protein
MQQATKLNAQKKRNNKAQFGEFLSNAAPTSSSHISSIDQIQQTRFYQWKSHLFLVVLLREYAVSTIFFLRIVHISEVQRFHDKIHINIFNSSVTFIVASSDAIFWRRFFSEILWVPLLIIITIPFLHTHLSPPPEV